MMVRTQMYYDREMYDKIVKIKKLTNKSFAEVVRKMLEGVVDEQLREVKKKMSLKEILTQMPVYKGKDVPRDLSEHMDDYLYGGL